MFLSVKPQCKLSVEFWYLLENHYLLLSIIEKEIISNYLFTSFIQIFMHLFICFVDGFGE